MADSLRWERKSIGKSGYSLMCENEWRAGISEKSHIKCLDCDKRILIPLSGSVIYDRLISPTIVKCVNV
jgi:hypothetical protein